MYLKSDKLLKNGEYRIKKTLGRGGFGITYLAEQVMFGREVAIKEFYISDYCGRDNFSRVEMGTTGSHDMVVRFKDKFLNEARNIARLRHANVISIYDVFEENNTAYYVMEYHSGGSLGAIVDENGAMSEQRALFYIRQVAAALEYVHGCHMLHLDVKPDNILVDGNEKAVLIDFGLAKLYDDETVEASGYTIRKSSIPVYSPCYAPIEQYHIGGVSTFNPATDIYSLGATLYTLLAGKNPPPAPELVNNKTFLQPLIEKGISKKVIATIKKSMSSKKEDRPQSVSEFLLLLTKGEKNNKWAIIAGAIMAVLAAVIINVFLFWGGTPSVDEYYKMGVSAYKNAEYTKAVKYWSKCVTEGNDAAQCNLAVCYSDGLGVDKNLEKAAELYRKAAEQGNALAQYKLGECYENSKGVRKSVTEAFKWYKQAAEQGNVDAQKKVANSYYNAIGVNKNLAAAAEWWLKAAEQGDLTSMYLMGVCYETGRGVEKDIAKAVKYYREAAIKGNVNAKKAFGRLCE